MRLNEAGDFPRLVVFWHVSQGRLTRNRFYAKWFIHLSQTTHIPYTIMKNLFLTFGLCALAAAAGCSLIPSGPGKSAPAVVVVPNPGTSWTFQNTYRDSNNVVTKIDTSTRVVVDTGMVYKGDSNVVMTVETFASTKETDTIYFRYLSTGDIARLSTPLIGHYIASVWLTIPYHSHETTPFPYAWSGGFSLRGYTGDSVTFSSSWVDETNDTVAGVLYDASVVNVTITEHYFGPGKDSIDVQNQTNSFIPSNGIFGNRQTTLHTINGKQAAHVQQVLIAVNL
jgi:hypothetical protein